MTGQSQGNIIKELTHTGLLHDAAEQYKQEDIAGRYTNGGTIDTLGVGKEMVGQRCPVIAAMHKHTGHAAAIETIADKDKAQDRKGIARYPSAGFKNQSHQQGRHDHICLIGITGSLYYAQIISINVCRCSKGQQNENPVENSRLCMI